MSLRRAAPHAETHTVVMPRALAYDAAAAPQAMARVARRLGVADATDAATALQRLTRNHGAPSSLAALGLPESALDCAADLAVLTSCPNPRPLERAALRALLQRAYDGAPPAV